MPTRARMAVARVAVAAVAVVAVAAVKVAKRAEGEARARAKR
jgi:hypothetical protein